MTYKGYILKLVLPMLLTVSALVSHAQNIDYRAVQQALDRASQPTLLQRVADRLSMPLSSRENLQLASNIGVAYTRETNLALTLSASAAYRAKDKYPFSQAGIAAMASVDGFYRVHVSGEHLFRLGEGRLIYEASVSSLPTRFWGLGYDAAVSNARTRYTLFTTYGSATYLHHIAHGLHIGTGIDLRYGAGREIEPLAEEYLQWAGQGVRSIYTTGLSLTTRYDTRNSPHTATRGLYIVLTGEIRPKALGQYSQTLWHVTAQANYYQPLWQGAVAALDLYADAWSSSAPWFYWPSLGGQSRMRGYYYGRYSDRKMATAQVELRQSIYGPVGVVVWGGAGSVFSSLKTFDWDEILPSYGLGLRLSANERTVLRIDYGFGRKCSGLIINVNEAF